MNEIGYEQLFTEFADNVNDLFWIRDTDNILYVNQAYERIWGKNREELYSNPSSFFDAVVEEDRARVQAAFGSELFDARHVFNEIYKIRTHSGEIRWIHARSFPVYDAQGSYVRSTGIARDISGEKRLAIELRQMNTQLSEIVKLETLKRLEKEMAFSSIFEMMGASVCIIDSNGLLIDANGQFLSLFGCDFGESIRGVSLCDLLQGNSREVGLCDIIKETFRVNTDFAKCDGRKKDPYEWRITTAQGVRISVIANVASFDNHRKEQNIIISMIDITAMRELEKKQKESEKLLIAQSKMAAMGEMIGAIAHQWRQPLNILGLMVQDVPFAFKNSELNAEYTQKFSNNAMKQIELMSKTIDDFRNFFRNDKKLVKFALVSQTKKSLALVGSMFKTHGIEILFNEETDPLVEGYPNELSQAILNIVTNAKDAFGAVDKKADKPQVAITVKQNGKWGEITIKDNAGGIPVHVMDRIFEPYFTTKAPDQGTGIGLYMSKTIVESNMGGILGVCNDDNGAVFTIKIPLAGE